MMKRTQNCMKLLTEKIQRLKTTQKVLIWYNMFCWNLIHMHVLIVKYLIDLRIGKASTGFVVHFYNIRYMH